MEDNPFKFKLIQKLEKILNLASVSETTSEGRMSFTEIDELRTEFENSISLV